MLSKNIKIFHYKQHKLNKWFLTIIISISYPWWCLNKDIMQFSNLVRNYKYLVTCHALTRQFDNKGGFCLISSIKSPSTARLSCWTNPTFNIWRYDIYNAHCMLGIWLSLNLQMTPAFNMIQDKIVDDFSCLLISIITR